MAAIESTVTAVKLHEGNRYGMQIAGVWYNGFGKPPAAEGDLVNVTYKIVTKNEKTYNNVESCVVLKAPEPQEIVPKESPSMPASDHPAQKSMLDTPLTTEEIRKLRILIKLVTNTMITLQQI